MRWLPSCSGSSEPRVRSPPGSARPYRGRSASSLRSSAAPVSSCCRGPAAVTSPRRPAVRVRRAGTTRDVLGILFCNCFFLFCVFLAQDRSGLRPASEAVRSRGALGAPVRPFRQPGAASFEPLLFVAGLSWPGKGERRQSGGELPGAGWTGELPPPPGSGAAGRSFVPRPPRLSPPRPGCGTGLGGGRLSAAKRG